jgi:Protein of unknown function (DUF3303)
MLFHVSYQPRTGAAGRVSLDRFTKWTPPAGFEFKSHHAAANGRGYAIVETGSGVHIIEATAPFGDVLEFEIVPVVEIGEAVPILMKANAWVDSVS